MKLFDKYNRLNISATILTFVIGSCTFYFLLNYILIHQIDETLETEQQEIISFVNAHNSMPEVIPTNDQYISYFQVDAKSDTRFLTVKNNNDKEEENERELQFTVDAGGKHYLVKVDKPLEETESLLQIIIGVTIAMIGIILLIGYLINRIVIRRLWKPFYETIDKVKGYYITDQDTLKLKHVGIDEFSLLNQSINEMTERIQQDYAALKIFTGQAAHEMQTPLAVIRSKLDMLMQNEGVLEKSAKHVTDIEKAVQRLSRLHKSLLLLTKVENRQFELNEEIRLDHVVKNKWSEYAEMADSMNLNNAINIQPLTIIFHHHLAEILVGNLIGNAIGYNIPGGNIEMTLQDNRLAISNTSGYGQLDHSMIFKRFYRGRNSEEGTGLGLSIVKQICDMAGYQIGYDYKNDRHIFTIIFNKPRF